MSEKLTVGFSGALRIWGRKNGMKSGVSTGYYVMIQPERRRSTDVVSHTINRASKLLYCFSIVW